MDIESPKLPPQIALINRSARPSLATRNSKQSNQMNIVSKLTAGRHVSIVQHIGRVRLPMLGEEVKNESIRIPSASNSRENSPKHLASPKKLSNFTKIDLSPSRKNDRSPSQLSSTKKDSPAPEAWGHISELDSGEESGSDSSRSQSHDQHTLPQIDLQPKLYTDNKPADLAKVADPAADN